MGRHCDSQNYHGAANALNCLSNVMPTKSIKWLDGSYTAQYRKCKILLCVEVCVQLIAVWSRCGDTSLELRYFNQRLFCSVSEDCWQMYTNLHNLKLLSARKIPKMFLLWDRALRVLEPYLKISLFFQTNRLWLTVSQVARFGPWVIGRVWWWTGRGVGGRRGEERRDEQKLSMSAGRTNISTLGSAKENVYLSSTDYPLLNKTF